MHRLFLLALALLASPALAGLRATYAVDGRTPMVIEIADNGDLRAMLGYGQTLVVRRGEAFVIEDRLTGPLVIPVEHLAVVAAEHSVRTHRGPRRARRPMTLIERGRAEVNGRSGRAFFRPPLRDETSEYRIAVISDDPALAALGPAIRRIFAVGDMLAELETISRSEGSIDDSPAMQLLNEGAPLDYSGMSLRRVEQAPIDAAHFPLPTAPETLSALRARLAAEEEAEARAHRSDSPHMISRALFAGGRLWLLTDTGRLSSLAEGETARTTHDFGEDVLDLCERDDAPMALTGRRDGGSRWTVHRREAGQWRRLRAIAPEGDYFIALSCGPGGEMVLTNRRLIDLGRADGGSLVLAGEMAVARVNSVVHVTPESVFVGINDGEWGGGLRRIDRRTGRIDTIERNATGDLCDGPLNTRCDPVHGLATLPWRRECVAAAVGLIHMFARGRIVSICPGGVEQMFVTAGAIDPENSDDVAEAATGGYGSVAFFGLAAVGGELVAIGQNGLYRLRADGTAVHQDWPRYVALDGILVSFALPDFVLVLTGINARASLGGSAPLLVVR